MEKSTITICTSKEIRDEMKSYAKSQGLTFSIWAMLELKKVMAKGQKV
jgi:hypothetical protein